MNGPLEITEIMSIFAQYQRQSENVKKESNQLL